MKIINIYQGSINFISRLLLRFAFFLKKQTHKKNYEPIMISGKFYKPTREWEERWKAISEVFKKHDVKSLLDVGCAEGWFLRRASEDFNCFSIGVEMSESTLFLSETARIYDLVDGVAIMKCTLNSENARNLPKCDAVLCLSVVHHIVKENGFDDAKRFLKALSTRANKVFVFEMGTSEELKMGWSKKMPEMKEGQEEYLKNLLSECGFQKIRQIAKTAGIARDAERILIAAEPVKK